MNKIVFCVFLLFCSSIATAQNTEPRILYIVDSIPLIETPKDDDQLVNDDIDNLEVVTDLSKIKTLGYENKIDKVIYITTKAYKLRSAESKLVPSTNAMTKKNGIWFMANSITPYTGPFIDYFINGKKQGEGFLKNGVIDGVRTVYYPNGNKRYYYTYTNGVENGASEEYFTTGKLKQNGSFINQKQTGLWQVFYSTGKLKRQSTFLDGKEVAFKEDTKFYSLLQKGVDLLKEEDYVSSMKKMDDAAKINAGYADLYFYRGTAKLENFDFDNAVKDFDTALEIEPLYMEAASNRAFARLRKYQFKDSRTLSKTNGVTILASKDKVSIPKEDQDKICADLNLGYELGDRKPMIIDAIANYCK